VDLVPKCEVFDDEGLARPKHGSDGAEYDGEHPASMPGHRGNFNPGNADEF
jgi:hypothetical protein